MVSTYESSLERLPSELRERLPKPKRKKPDISYFRGLKGRDYVLELKGQEGGRDRASKDYHNSGGIEKIVRIPTQDYGADNKRDAGNDPNK